MNQVNQYEKKFQESIGKRISRSKAIRLKCLDCSGFQSAEVKHCPVVNCPLWRYRMGYEQRDELYYQHKNKIEKE